MCMIVCVCNLESMLQLKQESNEKVCAGIEFVQRKQESNEEVCAEIEFACVFMLKLYYSARSKERIEVSQRMSFRCELCFWQQISFAAELCCLQ